jgi:hypothetical protein
MENKKETEILKPEDWFRQKYPFKDHGHWAYLDNNEGFVSWSDKAIQEYTDYVIKLSLPSEEEIKAMSKHYHYDHNITFIEGANYVKSLLTKGDNK